MVAIGLFYGGLTAVRDELFSADIQEKFHLNQLLPSLSWSAWGLISLGIVVIILFEAGYRRGEELVNEIAALKQAKPLLVVEAVARMANVNDKHCLCITVSNPPSRDKTVSNIEATIVSGSFNVTRVSGSIETQNLTGSSLTPDRLSTSLYLNPGSSIQFPILISDTY
jgi:hypothetical protein